MKRYVKPVLALLCCVLAFALCTVVWARVRAEHDLETYLENCGILDGPVLPEDTDEIHWKLYEYESIVYGDKLYDVVQLIAIGRSPDCLLYADTGIVDILKGGELPSQQVPMALRTEQGVVDMGSFETVERLWTGPKPQNYCQINYRGFASIAFIYVKEAEQSEDQFRLCYYTNKIELTGYVYNGGVVDSEPISRSMTGNASVCAATFDDPVIPAVEAYLGLRDSFDYIETYEFIFFDGLFTTGKFDVPTPFAEGRD